MRTPQPTTDDVRGLCLAMNEVRDYDDKEGILNMWGHLKRFLEQFPPFVTGEIATATIPDGYRPIDPDLDDNRRIPAEWSREDIARELRKERTRCAQEMTEKRSIKRERDEAVRLLMKRIDESDARAERIAELEERLNLADILLSGPTGALEQNKRLEAETAKLREALAFYSGPSDYVSPLTGGQGKLYYDCGGTAKRALAGKEPVRTENGPPCPECGYDGPSKWSQGLWRCPECWASMETGKEGPP